MPSRRGKRVCFVIEKGGTGKTLFSIVCAQSALAGGLRVAICDLDRQQDFRKALDGENCLVLSVKDLIKREQDYDIAIIDTPPGESGEKEYAVGISDLILIPISHSFSALDSAATRVKNSNPERTFVVLNMPNPSFSLEKEITKTAEELFNVLGKVQQYAKIRNNITMGRYWNYGLKAQEEEGYIALMTSIIDKLSDL